MRNSCLGWSKAPFPSKLAFIVSVFPACSAAAFAQLRRYHLALLWRYLCSSIAASIHGCDVEINLGFVGDKETKVVKSEFRWAPGLDGVSDAQYP